MIQTCFHGQAKPAEQPTELHTDLPAPTSQPIKRKHGPKKNTPAKEPTAAQEVELAVNKGLAELEAAHSCDNDLPIPCPLSNSQHSSTLSWTSSQADILALIAQQRCVGREVATGSTGGGFAGGRST